MGYLSRLFYMLTLLESFIDRELIILMPEGDFPGDRLKFPFPGTHLVRRPDKKPSEEESRAIAEDISSDYEVTMALNYCHNFPDALDMACLNRIQSDKLRSFLTASAAPVPERLL